MIWFRSMRLRLAALSLVLCGAAGASTPPGTVITITARCGESVAHCNLIVVNPALWRDLPRLRPFYSPGIATRHGLRHDPLLNGGPRKGSDGRVGVQTTSGALFPMER